MASLVSGLRLERAERGIDHLVASLRVCLVVGLWLAWAAQAWVEQYNELVFGYLAYLSLYSISPVWLPGLLRVKSPPSSCGKFKNELLHLVLSDYERDNANVSR